MRVLRPHQPPPVGDPVDMGIHTNPFFIITEGDHEVSGFPSDSLQLHQLLYGIGHPSAVSLDNLPAEIPDRSGFDPIKANRINRFFNPFRGQPGHLFRCLRDSKETFRGLSGHFVLRSQTEKAGDQNLERVPFRRGHLIEPREPERGHLLLQDGPVSDEVSQGHECGFETIHERNGRWIFSPFGL